MAQKAKRTRAGRDRLEVVKEAGLSRFSILSVLAGTLTAYGAFALVAAIAGGILSAADVDTDFSTNDWAGSGAIGGLVTAIVLLVSYLFGGYVAGRMARRSGLLHGAAVFVLSILGGAIAGAVVGGLSDSSDVERNLRSIGVPTSGDEWSGVSLATAIAAIAAMLIGALVGGKLGERWHSKLARRAADPSIGPAADARRQAREADEHREQELRRDQLVEREAQRTGGNNGKSEPDEPGGSSSRNEPRYTASEWGDIQREASSKRPTT